MIILALTLAAWALLRKYSNKPKRRAAYTASVISPSEIARRYRERERAAKEAERAEAKRQREEEKARKAEQARQLAQIELDHLEFLKSLYGEQFNALEAERKAATTNERRRAKIDSEILKLDEKRYKIDMQIAKAYYKAQQIAQN